MSEREALLGPRAVGEALRAGRRRVDRILVARGGTEPLDEILALAQRAGVRVEWVGREALDRRAGGLPHQGVVAEGDGYPYVEVEALLEVPGPDALLVVLDGIQDPQNLGAILRTAEAAAAAGALLPRDRAVPVTPAAVRASAGAAEHLRVARAANLAAFLTRAKAGGFWVLGADAGGGTELYQADLTGRVALVFGSEGRGLRALTKRHCDRLVHIPLRGRVASLNVSAAAAICLFEAVRQRQRKLELSVDSSAAR